MASKRAVIVGGVAVAAAVVTLLALSGKKAVGAEISSAQATARKNGSYNTFVVTAVVTNTGSQPASFVVSTTKFNLVRATGSVRGYSTPDAGAQTTPTLAPGQSATVVLSHNELATIPITSVDVSVTIAVGGVQILSKDFSLSVGVPNAMMAVAADTVPEWELDLVRNR